MAFNDDPEQVGQDPTQVVYQSNGFELANSFINYLRFQLVNISVNTYDEHNPNQVSYFTQYFI